MYVPQQRLRWRRKIHRHHSPHWRLRWQRQRQTKMVLKRSRCRHPATTVLLLLLFLEVMLLLRLLLCDNVSHVAQSAVENWEGATLRPFERVTLLRHGNKQHFDNCLVTSEAARGYNVVGSVNDFNDDVQRIIEDVFTTQLSVHFLYPLFTDTPLVGYHDVTAHVALQAFEPRPAHPQQMHHEVEFLTLLSGHAQLHTFANGMPLHLPPGRVRHVFKRSNGRGRSLHGCPRCVLGRPDGRRERRGWRRSVAVAATPKKGTEIVSVW